MRGQILGIDVRTGHGIVSGDDGQRYTFDRQDWAQHHSPAVGAQVDFEADGKSARSVFPIVSSVPSIAAGQSLPTNDRNKVVAAVLAFFIGTLGIDRFYLGRTGSGIVRIILSITIVGLFVSAVWAFIDAVRYLVMSDAEFDAKYQRR